MTLPFERTQLRAVHQTVFGKAAGPAQDAARPTRIQGKGKSLAAALSDGIRHSARQ